MSGELTPIKDLVSPEQFADHVRAALGEGFTVKAPNLFGHGRELSYFIVTCPTASIAQILPITLERLGAESSPSAALGPTQCRFHIPTMFKAREIVPKLTEIGSRFQSMLLEQQRAEAQGEIVGKARAALTALLDEYFGFFGRPVTHISAFARPIPVGDSFLSGPISLQANQDSDVVYDENLRQPVDLPKGAVYDRIIGGKIDPYQVLAIYHNPATEQIHYFDFDIAGGGEENSGRLQELVATVGAEAIRLNAILSDDPPSFTAPRHGAPPRSRENLAACKL